MPQQARPGARPLRVSTMLRIHFLQQSFGLSEPAMEEALRDTPLYCKFTSLDAGITRLPDESTILRFRHLVEENNLNTQIMATINATVATKGLMLKTGKVVDATLIAAHRHRRSGRRQRCDPNPCARANAGPWTNKRSWAPC